MQPCYALCRYKLDITFFFNFFSWKITFPVAYCWDRNCSLIVLYRAKCHTLSMGWWTFIFSWRGNSDQNYNLPSFLSFSCSPAPAPIFHTNRLWIFLTCDLRYQVRIWIYETEAQQKWNAFFMHPASGWKFYWKAFNICNFEQVLYIIEAPTWLSQLCTVEFFLHLKKKFP